MLSSTSTSVSTSSETSEWSDEEIAKWSDEETLENSHEKSHEKPFEKVLRKHDKNISDDDVSDVFKEESEECPYDIKCELPNIMIVKVSKPPINKKLPMNAIKKYMVSFVNFVRMTSDVYISDKMFRENLERLKKEFNEMLEIVNKRN